MPSGNDDPGVGFVASLRTAWKIRGRLARGGTGASLRAKLHDLSDAEWLWALTEGRRRLPALAAQLPSLPDETLQAQYTGLSGDAGLRVAVAAAALFGREARRRGVAIGTAEARLLDFGCGWGRITQAFLRDFDPANITGVDVDPDTITLCRSTGIGCSLLRVEPEPPLALPDDSIDLVTAFSVFSHLSEANHWAWLQELHRVLRPGGVLAVTTRPREFIDHVVHLRTLDSLPDFARGAAESFIDAEASYAAYDAGEYCFDVAGGGGGIRNDFYGEALIPAGYVERRWSKLFAEVDFVSHLDHGRFDQNVLVARK